MLICGRLTAQDLIGHDRLTVRDMLEKKIALKDSFSRQLQVSDSTMTLTLKDAAGKPLLSTICSFNTKGLCFEERTTAPCGDCLKPWLEKVLADKERGWKKINEHQYISNFEQKMFLELPPEGEQSFFKIFRVEWTKEMYEILKGSNVN